MTLSAAVLSTGTTTMTFGAFPVHFTVCQVSSGTTCAGTSSPVATASDTIDLSSSSRTYSSAPFTPLLAGTFCFTATYTKDAYPPLYDAGTASNAAGECFLAVAPPTTTVVTTTTVATTTTTATTTTSPPPATITSDSGRTPSALKAQLITVKTTHSKLGRRLVEVELTTNMTATVMLTLTRQGQTLATTTVNRVRPGDRFITVVVPSRVGKGAANVRVQVTPAIGRSRSFHAGIFIPRR